MGTFLELVIVAIESNTVVTFLAERDALGRIRRPVMVVETVADIPNLLLELIDSAATERAGEFPVPAEL